MNLVTTEEKVDWLCRAWRRGGTPPPRISMVEWAERYRKLSKESSNGGRFRVSRVEVARGPMLAVTEPGVRNIVVMACTQLLKTTFLENVLGYFMHLDPGPALVVLPKDDAAETWSKDRLAPMIRDTKVLRKMFAGRARDAGNTLTHKQFPGGHVTLVGANSPTNLAMRPIRLLVCDETDKYEESSGNEGPPIELAKERQAEFKDTCLSVEASSPTVAGHSNIETAYEESDQRKPFVACPHCGEKQVLEWEQVRWDKAPNGQPKLETAALHCAGCGVAWSDADRLRALKQVWWRQTKVFDCCGERQHPERWRPTPHGVELALCRHCDAPAVSNESAGFVASKLYAPKEKIRDLVKKWLRACRIGAKSQKTFVNTQLARTWKEADEAPEWDEVFNRRDAYASGTVPLRALLLMGGADVQKDRIEVGIWAFGRNRERWLVEHRVLPGPTNQPEVWAKLATVFDETWTHELGGDIGVDSWGIDSSGFTADVYAFVRSQAGRGNVHAVDGQDSYGAAYLGVGAKDADAAGKKLRRGLKTLKIGVSFCKKELVEQLALKRPEDGVTYPPGFVHLAGDVEQEVVKQLTAEEMTTVSRNGRDRRKWTIIAGRRNEVLDCANYARGLAAMRGWERMKEGTWQAIETRLRPVSMDAAAAAAAPTRRVARSNYLARMGR